MIKEKNFHRAGPKAVALLKKFAPHKGGNIALRAIHDLDMQDKHRSIVPSLISTISPEMHIGQSIVLEATQKPSSIQVIFPNDSVFAGEEIIPILHNLVKVTTGVIEAFEALAQIP